MEWRVLEQSIFRLVTDPSPETFRGGRLAAGDQPGLSQILFRFLPQSSASAGGDIGGQDRKPVCLYQRAGHDLVGGRLWRRDGFSERDRLGQLFQRTGT